MNVVSKSRDSLLVVILTLIALGLLAAVFYSPVWWVSLTAPNYPEESFPDGVRIHFHMNGVFNGCKKVAKAEIQEEEALDCVHEMDTINHYVGMYPIAAGGPVERGFSQFLMVFLAVMLVGFLIDRPKVRMAFMSLGFLAILIWMYLTIYGSNGFNLQNSGYVSALVTSLDQEATGESADEPELTGGSGIIERLRQSLEQSGVQMEGAGRPVKKAMTARESDKARLIEQLKTTYEKDREKARVKEPWDGSSFQVMTWHYGKSLGRYFNNPAEIDPMVRNLGLAINLFFVFMIGAMALLIFGARRNGGILYWLLVLVPMALPLFFVIDYSAWLWWYGHTLNDMGAFTVKPFMPTVFGDGKVAQFSTHSYPYYGFGLMVLMAFALGLAAVIRRRQLKQTG